MPHDLEGCDGFQRLRMRLRTAQDSGRLAPTSSNITNRFKVVASDYLAPLLVRLVRTLEAEGLTATFLMALDEDCPLVGLHILYPETTVTFSAASNGTWMTLESAAESYAETIGVAFRAIIDGDVVQILEPRLIRALCGPGRR